MVAQWEMAAQCRAVIPEETAKARLELNLVSTLSLPLVQEIKAKIPSKFLASRLTAGLFDRIACEKNKCS